MVNDGVEAHQVQVWCKVLHPLRWLRPVHPLKVMVRDPCVRECGVGVVA